MLRLKWEEILDILRPFPIHTDQIQTHVLAMLCLIPAIHDLQCHVANPSLNPLMAETLRRSLNKRFSSYLNPGDFDLDPLPAVACPLASDVAKQLFTYYKSIHCAAVISDESVSAMSTPSTSDTYNLQLLNFLSEILSPSGT